VPGYQYVQSVLRALDILAVVSSSDRGEPTHYLARALDLNEKTAHNLLRTLVHRGFLEKVSSPPRYRLGQVMNALRERQEQWTHSVLMPAIPHCIRISRKMRANTAVSQYTGGDLFGRFTSKWEQSELATSICLFARPAYGCALAYQAFMREKELADYRATHRLEGNDLEYWKSVHMVDCLLSDVRTEGYLAFVKSNVFRVAAPIFDSTTKPSAMLSLTKPFPELQRGGAQECVAMVRQAADELSLDAASPTKGDERVLCFRQ